MELSLGRITLIVMPQRKLGPSLKARLVEFVPIILGGVALGLGLAWAKKRFGLNGKVIDLILIAFGVLGLLVMAVCYYALYRAYLEDDEW
jgi:hypothetical protein